MKNIVYAFVFVNIVSCSKNIDKEIENVSAEFNANQTIIIVGNSINFTDLSSGSPTDWSWTFQGGTPENSTDQNPTNIIYNSVGTFNVTLSVSNANGSNVKTKTAYIIVSSNPNLPSVTTTAVSNINATSAKSGGNITNQGASPVTERGLCWNTSSNPTITNSNTKEGVGIGSFTSNIIDLQKSTKYYVRSYATNSYGTAYGNELTFTTAASFNNCGTVTDIDGNIYNTVTIGDQCWMMENLKTTRFNDGTSIPKVTTGWYNLPTPAYCYYTNDTSKNNTYGKLYNFYAVKTGKLAPAGWHVPSDSEWTVLFKYLGGVNYPGGVNWVGSKMKAISTLWNINTDATNSSGFTALPAGIRQIDYGTLGSIDFGLGDATVFWSSTWIRSSNSRSSSYALDKYYHDVRQYNDFISFGSGYSVRCIKD